MPVTLDDQDSQILDQVDDSQKEKRGRLIGSSEAANIDIVIAPKVVEELTRVILEYKQGPRAGMKSKFFLTSSRDNNKGFDGYQPLPVSSPLGQVVFGAYEGDVVSFSTKNATVETEVEIIEVIK